MAAKNQPKPADGITKTAIESEDGLGELPKGVAFMSPWGTKVTVGADLADQFKDAGYKPAK